MDAEGNNNNIRTYIYRGEEGEVIPRDGNHIIVIVHEDVTVILADTFYEHRKILEVICHEGVKRIEHYAFCNCTSLRRVVMPGIKIIGRRAFCGCTALTDVECGNLDVIYENAFYRCTSLRTINLQCVKIVKGNAFCGCNALTHAKFGSKLGRIEEKAFLNCRSLEQITIPLRDGLITGDDIFRGCDNLKHIDLVEGELHETIDALLLDDWRNDMNEEIDFLPNTHSGYYGGGGALGQTRAIQRWIKSVLRKIIHYQAKHQRVLDEAGSTLLHALPQDIVTCVLSFLVLPSYTFVVED